MKKIDWRNLISEIGFYLGAGLVLFLLFSALESAKAQFGTSNRVISSPAEIELKPNTYVELDGFLNVLTQNEIRFNDSAGGEYVSLKAPTTVSSSVNFILPSIDGSADQFLKTDGLGNWSFDDVPLAFTPSNDNRVLRSDTSGGNIQESGVTLDDTDSFSGVNGINLTGASIINFTEISEPSTPASTLARLYFDSTEKKLASKDDAGEVIIYGEGGGASDVENSIDGSFDDEVDLFTHTTGTGAVVTSGGHLDTTENPSPYINLTTGTTHDHEICRTLEVGRQYEVGCYIKSTLDDISVCYNNGTSDETCNTSYDGSDVYKYVFQRGTADTGEQVCLRITSPSTSAIEADSCRIGEPKFEDISVAPIRYSTDAGQSFTSGSTDIIDYEDITFDSDGLVTTGVAWKYTAAKPGFYKVCAAAAFDNTTSDAAMELQLYKNGVLTAFLDEITPKQQDATSERTFMHGCDTVELSEGDFIDVRGRQATGGNLSLAVTTARNYISITKHEATLSTGVDNFKNSLVKAADNGFTGGTIRINREGEQVCLSADTTLTWVSASSVATSIGFLPTWARPKAVLTTVFDMDASRLKRSRIDTNGEISLNFRDYAGAASNDSATGSFNHCYPVE